jgi:hypothetical protein
MSPIAQATSQHTQAALSPQLASEDDDSKSELDDDSMFAVEETTDAVQFGAVRPWIGASLCLCLLLALHRMFFIFWKAWALASLMNA